MKKANSSADRRHDRYIKLRFAKHGKMHAYWRGISKARHAHYADHLPEEVEIGRMGEQEACPLTGIAVVGVQGGKECQQVRSYFESGPTRDGHGSYQ